MPQKIIAKPKANPDKAPRQGKDDLVVLSKNQESPREAKPEDFQPITDELEFSGHCGDTPEECEQLLRAGPRGRQNPDSRKFSRRGASLPECTPIP